MSDLRNTMEEYLALRRSLGFRLRDVAGTLRNFVAFAESQTTSHVTIDSVLQWVKLSTAKESATLAQRLHIVRRFAMWRSATDGAQKSPKRPSAFPLPSQTAIYLQR